MIGKNFQHHFHIQLHDTDAAGVLFFAHLLRHAHDAYEHWMRELGFPIDAMIRDASLALPLVHTEADFRKPLRHGDRVCVTLAVADQAESSFSIDYRFYAGDDQLAATARTVHVSIHPGSGQVQPLPGALAEALNAQRGETNGTR